MGSINPHVRSLATGSSKPKQPKQSTNERLSSPHFINRRWSSVFHPFTHLIAGVLDASREYRQVTQAISYNLAHEEKRTLLEPDDRRWLGSLGWLMALFGSLAGDIRSNSRAQRELAHLGRTAASPMTQPGQTNRSPSSRATAYPAIGPRWQGLVSWLLMALDTVNPST